MPPSLQDIVNQSTGGVAGPRSAAQPTLQDIVNKSISTSASEPLVISSDQGKTVVDKATERLNNLQGVGLELVKPEATPAPTPTPAPEGKSGNTEVMKDFVTFINPETGQETTLRGEAVTESNRTKLKEQGYEESTSDVSTTPASKEQQAAEAAKKMAEANLVSQMSKLESSAITSKELRQQVSRIKQVYSGRMRRMEETNRRRQQTFNTLGIRLGSRYTGGSSGTFGSIIAEEERQGFERIDAIENEMLAAISTAEKAAKEHNYGVYVKQVDLAQKKYDEKVKAFTDLEAIQKKADEELRQEEETVANQADVIEQIQGGLKNPMEIFTALGGKVPFDVIKSLTDTLPQEAKQDQFTLGRYDIRYDSEGNVIARGTSAGGGGGTGDVNISGLSSFGMSSGQSVGEPTVAGIGRSYATSTVEAQMVIDDILNKIPAQLRNTEKETELKKEQIRKQLAAGYSYQDVVDRLSGFSLQGEKADKSLGSSLYNASLGTDIDVGQLASLINRGAGEQAMSLVENKKLETADGFFAGTDKARATVKQADVVLSLLNDPKFPKDKLGAFDGRKFKVGRFAGLTDKETLQIQQLETALQLLASPIRVEVAGTAATDSEMAKISAFQSDILDQPDIIKTQVSTLRDSVVNFHNEARAQRGLPQVNREQIIDNKKRLELYREAGQVDELIINSQKDNSSLLNSGAWSGNEPATKSNSDNKSFFNGI